MPSHWALLVHTPGARVSKDSGILRRVAEQWHTISWNRARSLGRYRKARSLDPDSLDDFPLGSDGMNTGVCQR